MVLDLNTNTPAAPVSSSVELEEKKDETQETAEQKKECCGKVHFGFTQKKIKNEQEMEAFKKTFPDCTEEETLDYFRASIYIDRVFGLCTPSVPLICSKELDIIKKITQDMSQRDPSMSFAMAMVQANIYKHVKKTNPELYRSYPWN